MTLFSAAKHPVRKPAWLGAHFALTLADLGGGPIRLSPFQLRGLSCPAAKILHVNY